MTGTAKGDERPLGPLLVHAFSSGCFAHLFQYISYFLFFILLFTSSSPCRKDQSIVLIHVYNWEIRHHSLVCCCGLADILYALALLTTRNGEFAH